MIENEYFYHVFRIVKNLSVRFIHNFNGNSKTLFSLRNQIQLWFLTKQIFFLTTILEAVRI